MRLHQTAKLFRMRTTLDLPDALLRQLKAQAALDGTTLKSLIAELVERGLAQRSATPSRAPRSKLPTLVPRRPLAIKNPTNARLFELLDDE